MQGGPQCTGHVTLQLLPGRGALGTKLTEEDEEEEEKEEKEEEEKEKEEEEVSTKPSRLERRDLRFGTSTGNTLGDSTLREGSGGSLLMGNMK
ncbi:hypothetical protein BTVI_37002 [Pitangus sulphuratus]|nr:hypothetical protein BTVI_37002 [Pitangus sulphuratus]